MIDLVGRVRPGELMKDEATDVSGQPVVGRIIGGDMLRTTVTLAAHGVAADLVVADPPWPGSFFRYDPAWEDDPNAAASTGSSSDDLVASERDWLRFMRPRVEAMRTLLPPTGVLVLTCEHRNLFRLGQLLDEVFGVANRLTVLGYAKQYVARGRAGVTYDYLLVAARDRQRWLEGPGAAAPIDPPQWWTLHDLADEPVDAARRGYQTAGINELTQVIGADHRFFHAKPSSLYRRIIETWCPRSGLVLDPFAGSGAAGHAVLDLNATGADRRFLLIDEIDHTIDGPGVARALTAERVRRVVTGDWDAGRRPPRPGGVSFETLAPYGAS